MVTKGDQLPADVWNVQITLDYTRFLHSLVEISYKQYGRTAVSEGQLHMRPPIERKAFAHRRKTVLGNL